MRLLDDTLRASGHPAGNGLFLIRPKRTNVGDPIVALSEVRRAAYRIGVVYDRSNEIPSRFLQLVDARIETGRERF
jgi:hypothetical protein